MRWDARLYDTVRAPQVSAGRELIALAKVRDEDAILDIGCGTGKLTAELAELAVNGRVTGIDPSEEMLDKARENTSGAKNITLLTEDIQSITFSDMFDLAFSNSALQWVSEQNGALKRVYNSLRKNGRIAFQLPAKGFCKCFTDGVKDAITALDLKETFSGWRSPWYFPTEEEYESLLAEAGFKNIRIFVKDYRLVFTSIKEVLDWWSSAGLRPFLALLNEKEQEFFMYAFAMSFEKNRTEKGIEIDFRRLFALAEK